MVQVTYMYYTGRLEVFNENFLVVSSLSLWHTRTFSWLQRWFDQQNSEIANTSFCFIKSGRSEANLCFDALQSSKRVKFEVLILHGVCVACDLWHTRVLGLKNLCSIFRRILKFLIPVKLSLGVLPKRTLLERYNLLEVCLLLFTGYCLSWMQL